MSYTQKVYLLSLFICTLYGEPRTIYIVPIGGHDVSKFFFDPYSYRDEVARPFCALREAIEGLGYTVKFTTDGSNLTDFAGLISLNDNNKHLLGNISQQDKNKCILIVFEPPVVMPSLHNDVSAQKVFGKIFIAFDNSVDHAQYCKFYYPQPRLQMIEDVPTFKNKKFCVLMNGNKDFSHPQALYSERRKVIRFFEMKHFQEFDLYGPDWHGYRSWKGFAQSKWDTLKYYKFCICYENMRDQLGYITEKIFDCLVAGCVPVYLGASNITDYVPASCFVDRRHFSSDEELYAFLKAINQEDYDNYLRHIKTYLNSNRVNVFSIEYFVKSIIRALNIG